MEMGEHFQKEEWTLGRQKQAISTTVAIFLFVFLQFTIYYLLPVLPLSPLLLYHTISTKTQRIFR